MVSASTLSRRAFLASSGALIAQPAPKLDLCVFSKHLHFLPWPEMAAAAKEVGFEGIDLTVRKGGHVSPERVVDDLPRAADAIRAAGMKLTMITTDIADLTTSYAETVLKTAAKVGVRHYRWDGYKYSGNQPLPDQLAAFAPRVRDLAAFNKEHGLCAMYHTHSGAGRVGASQWDLWLLIKDQDKRAVSFNFDIAHATVEGGLGGWLHSSQLALPHTGGIALKDFKWGQGPNKKWRVDWCPIGEGMVQIRDFLNMARKSGFQGPVQLHYEYDMGGADKGATKITWTRQQVQQAMKRDLESVRTLAREAGWSA